MKYSKLLNLGEILTTAPIHVIMRRPEHFPNYEAGTDIDLLVMDMGRMVDYLSRYLPNYTRYVISAHHIQIDHWAGPGQLDLKFDLYSLHISPVLTTEILATRMKLVLPKPWVSNPSLIEFSVPQPMMDNLLKCYEFLYNKKAKYKEFARYENLLKAYL